MNQVERLDDRLGAPSDVENEQRPRLARSLRGVAGPVFLPGGCAVLLIAAQPALGTALVIGFTLAAMLVAAVSDSVYALAAGRAGRALSAKRVRLLSRVSGGFLIGGGLWLAFSRR